MDNFIPVRIVGSDKDGNEGYVGDFPNGVVLQNMTLVDVQSQMPIAHLTKLPGTGTPNVPPVFVWEVPTLQAAFYYLFMQVMPEDGTHEVTIDGRRTVLH